MADPWTKEQRRALMRRVRTRDTAPELELRRAMWAAGVRGWRLHPRDVPGKPDVVWKGLKVAVFVDGAFWHGHPDHYWGQSGRFWDEKIAKNKARDQRVDEELDRAGWTVRRFWDFEVAADPVGCAEQVKALVLSQRERQFSAT